MIWDTAEQERYKNYKANLKAAAGIFMIFDLSSRDSFTNLPKWWKYIESLSYASRTVLLGNKSDLRDNREISYEEAKNFAETLNIPYIEVSAKNGNNIGNAFEVLVNIAIKNFKFYA